MGAEAVATLRQLWGRLEFAKVHRVIAREPEDILSISVYDDFGHMSYFVRSNRTKDIPAKDKDRAHVAWQQYFGYTENGIYFDKDNYHELDCDINLTMDWSYWSNHTDGFRKPEVKALLGGEVTHTPDGKKFMRWFECRPEFKLLVDIVLHGTTLTENELGQRLVTKSYPDKYWAIARLVLFDNVQAFVDELKPVNPEEDDSRPLHPAHGQSYGSITPSGKLRVVEHRGMWLSVEAPRFVHELSYHLKEPRWWEEFQRRAKQQNLSIPTHDSNHCNACEAEQISRRIRNNIS